MIILFDFELYLQLLNEGNRQNGKFWNRATFFGLLLGQIALVKFKMLVEKLGGQAIAGDTFDKGRPPFQRLFSRGTIAVLHFTSSENVRPLSSRFFINLYQFSTSQNVRMGHFADKKILMRVIRLIDHI